MSRFAPTKHRARMMATVFFMQPLGQIAGNIVSLVVIAIARGSSSPGEDLTRTVDIMWRWVIAIGVVPGAVATVFRFAIPESPRYLVDIVDDPVTAEFDATTLFSDTPGMIDTGGWGNTASCSAGSTIQLPPISSIASYSTSDHEDEDEFTRLPPATLNSHWRLARSDIMRYFWTEGNWRSLAGCSLAWLLLDFGFYGIGLSSPQFLAKTWGQLNISEAAPTWMTDDTPNANIYTMFMETSMRGLIILNIGSFVGGILLIIFAHKLDRVALQKYMFLGLAALFIALGTMFVTLYTGPPAVVALYIVGQIMFNFGELSPEYDALNRSNQLSTGPNATTYMIPAEIFPTRYRATCHGISAGAGKLGSILVQIFSTYYHFGAGPGNTATRKHGIVLIVFSVCMILGAVVTHFWIPPIQQTRNGRTKLWGGKPETLESMSLGRMGRKSRDADCRKRTSRHRALSMSA